MPDFLRFYIDNARWLLAAVLLTYASGFGQTFFIALFAGEIRQAFVLSHSEWGQIYATGTLAAAFTMMLLGGWVDRLSPRHMAALVLCGFILSCLGMALVDSAGHVGIALLVMVIFGLRFFGQGMMSHLSVVYLGRWFARNRGKSMAFAGLGFSLSEASLPILFVAIMLAFGWQSSWWFAMALLMAVGLVILLLLAKPRIPQSLVSSSAPSSAQAVQDDGQKANSADEGTPGMGGRHWQRQDLWSSPVFWLGLVAKLAHPMFSTILFFQVVTLTEAKGWSLAEFSALFPLYTACSLCAMFVVGHLIDRFGVSILLSLYLLPMALAMVVLAEGTMLYHAAIALMLHGVMQGSGSSLSGAFWPEYFGTKHLGSIRSLATAVMVFSTALGPLASGFLLDQGVDITQQLWVMSALTVIASGLFATMAWISRPLRRLS